MTASTTLSPPARRAPRDRPPGRALAGRDRPAGGPTAAEAVAAHSTLVAHDPDVAVLAETEADVVEAVRFAAHHGLRVRSHATGHGQSSPITDGVVLGTSGLAGVEVGPASPGADIGAGTRGRAGVAAPGPDSAGRLLPVSATAPFWLGAGILVLGVVVFVAYGHRMAGELGERVLWSRWNRTARTVEGTPEEALGEV